MSLLTFGMVDRRPVKCLVVDDDHDGADIVGAFLEELGADVQVVYDGQDAIRLGPSFRPRMVVLDLYMPIIDGFETCRQLRQQDWAGDAVFIAYTGTPEAKAVAVAAGFDRVVSKGDSPAVFERLLSDLAP